MSLNQANQDTAANAAMCAEPRERPGLGNLFLRHFNA